MLIALVLAGVPVAGLSVEALRSLKTVRLGGTDYVNAEEFGSRYGLKAQHRNGGRTLILSSAWTKLEIDADSRECAINGLRVFLGDAAWWHRKAVHISRLDAEKLFAPILLAGDQDGKLPTLKTIVLDPGHGGRDPGKENRRVGVNEKSLALDTALRLQRILETMGYRVVMTRTTDTHLGRDKASDLLQRAVIAKKAGADLFISLHYNAVGDSAQRVEGLEVYTLTPRNQYSTSDPEHEDNEGAAVANPGNANDHWNIQLGYQVHRRMTEELRVPDRGLKRARWAVLRHVECPAILIESGFLSNDAEARKIATPAYRQKIAVAIANGVQAYGNVLAGVHKLRRGQ